MATTGKTRLKKLLAKGLTGWEAGRLIIQTSIDRAEGRGGLSDSEIIIVRDSIKNPEDREDYNNLIQTGIEAYPLMESALCGGRLAAISLLEAHNHLQDCHLGWLIKSRDRGGPLLVTQKQYEELRDRRKEELLKKAWTLKEVIKKRIDHLDSLASYEMENVFGNIDDCAPCAHGYVDEFINFVKESYPDIHRQVFEEITSLIREDKLPLLNQKGKPAKKLIKKGGLSAQDLEAILEEAYVSGESLYNAGLPEWIEELDTIGELEVDGRKRPQVAIVQRTEPWNIDEQGHYRDFDKEDEERCHAHNMPGRGRAEKVAWYCAKQGNSLTELIQSYIQVAKVNIKGFLALKTAIAEFYDLVGAKPLLLFELEKFYEHFLLRLDIFNDDLRGLRTISGFQETTKRPPDLAIDPSKIELIEPEQLKPDNSEIQEWRETIASYGIGGGWWKRRRKAKPEPEAGEVEEEAPEVGEEASLDD